jgi:hypothetical protein
MMSLQLPTRLIQLGQFSPPTNTNWTNNVTDASGALSTLELIISSVIGLFTVGGALLFIYAFIQGAVDWITAGGDSGKIQKARDRMIQGALGLVILVMAYAIIGLIGTVVGINILNPQKLLIELIPINATM